MTVPTVVQAISYGKSLRNIPFKPLWFIKAIKHNKLKVFEIKQAKNCVFQYIQPMGYPTLQNVKYTTKICVRLFR